jgi:hypothetical protein
MHVLRSYVSVHETVKGLVQMFMIRLQLCVTLQQMYISLSYYFIMAGNRVNNSTIALGFSSEIVNHGV